MNLAKKILLTLVVIIIFTSLAIWALTKTILPSDVKILINNQLYALTTQKSHIDGNIGWQLFPRPGIKITQIHVGEENNKANYSIYIENLLFNLQISPLLRGHLVFDELKIDGLKININPEDQTNSNQNKELGTTTARQNKVSDNISVQFPLDRFLLTRGQITIMQPHNNITLTGLQIGANQLNLKNKFFPLQLKATLVSSLAENNINATINYKGRVRLTPFTLSQPLTTLQHATVDGQLLVQNLRFNQFKIARMNANMKTKQGEMVLNPLNFTLYVGKSVGDLHYHFASKKLSINQTATGLDAKQLFNDLFANNLVKGNLDFSIHATTNLEHNNWQNNLQGNGNLTIKDGVLYFIDLNKLMDETRNKIHSLLNQEKHEIKLALQQPLFNSTVHPQGNTQFQLLNIQYRILDTKLINDSVLLQTNKLQLKGRGQVNLSDATQDLGLSASTVDKIQQLLGGSFSLKVGGKLTKPQMSLNEQELTPIISSYPLNK